MKGKRTTQALGDVLKNLVKSSPWAKRSHLRELSEAWESAVGHQVSPRTRVIGLSAGTLTIHVESAVLRHEIEAFRKAEILERMAESLPKKRIVALRCLLRPTNESF